MIVLGIYGWSGSGKTDLVCRLIKSFSKKKFSVSTIKHTHHNIKIDTEGKDSYKHSESGAREVIIGGGNNWTLIHRSTKEKENYEIEYFLNKFSEKTDIILVEGFKNSKIPKIEVYNSNLQKPLINNNSTTRIAIIYDKMNKELLKVNIPKFSFNETSKISNFIINYFKKNEKK